MQILFIAKRDKSHVEVLGVMQNNSNFSKNHLITNLDESLKNLNDQNKFAVKNYYFENRMHYDLYLQDFPNFQIFKNYLINQGYKGVPTSLQPIFFEKENPAMQLDKPYVKKMMQRNRKKS